MAAWPRQVAAALLLMAAPMATLAQDVRYSWFEIAFVQQDVDKIGTQTDEILNQTVDINATDGTGIKFRGSVGTWNNLFAFVDFNSSDFDVAAVVTNPIAEERAEDEFDFTAVRAGIGVKWSLAVETDVYAAVSYDSLNFDFGSFAGEDFDTDGNDFGATIGIRSIFAERLELRAHARFSEVGDVDLATGEFDDDTLYGVGFGYELVRGLSITGDFESGQFSSFNIGFRLDLDED